MRVWGLEFTHALEVVERRYRLFRGRDVPVSCLSVCLSLSLSLSLPALSVCLSRCLPVLMFREGRCKATRLSINKPLFLSGDRLLETGRHAGLEDTFCWKTQRFADVPGTNFWTRRY